MDFYMANLRTSEGKAPGPFTLTSGLALELYCFLLAYNIKHDVNNTIRYVLRFFFYSNDGNKLRRIPVNSTTHSDSLLPVILAKLSLFNTIINIILIGRIL